MESPDAQVQRLIEARAAATGVATSTASRHLTGSGDTHARIVGGTSLTTRRVARIVQRASDHWPEPAPWPADIPRPEPSPGSPVALAREEAGRAAEADPVAAVRAARAKGLDCEVDDWAAIGAAQEEMWAVALRLGEDGRIASPEALCEAMKVPLDIYRSVVRRYADDAGARRSWPRPGGRSAEMLERLAASGDARFERRAAGLRLQRAFGAAA